MATLRRVISVFADGICQVLDVRADGAGDEKEGNTPEVPVVAINQELLFRLHSKLEPVLAQAQSAGRVRTLRMFLFKNLERRRGVSFLRSALLQSPFMEAKWMSDWKATGEIGLTRFLGSNKLPQNNPFIGFPLWDVIHGALAACLTPNSSSFSVLELALQPLVENPATRVLAKGCLLLCFFQESFLLQVLPEVPVIMRERLAALQAWMEGTSLFGTLPAHERSLLVFFAGGQISGCNAEVAQFMSISNSSSPEHIALVRVLAHVAAVALSSPGTDFMAFFQTVMLRPAEMAGSFFPCMPDDVTAMAVRVLGGRWYKCVNGHAYYVDACGRPTVIQKCATCGVDIGGTNHNPLPGQKDLDEKLEGNENYSQVSKVEGGSPSLYCLRDAKDESDPFDCPRFFTPLVNRTVRFLLHAALILGAVAHGAAWADQVRPLLNPTYSNPTDLGQSFLAHLNQDFGVVKKIVRKSDDDTALAMHMVLEKVRLQEKKSEQLTDEKMELLMQKVAEVEAQGRQDVAQLLRAQIEKMGGILHAVSPDAGRPTLPEEKLRNAWEENFNRAILHPVLNAEGKEGSLNDRLDAIQARFSNNKDDDDGVFTAELQERNDIEGLRVDAREASSPALWRYRRPFSYQDFVWQFQMNRTNQEKFVILDEFIKDEVQLRACRYLPQLVQWQSLLLQRYNRRIDQEAGITTTVRDVLAKEGKNAKWTQAFEGFKKAWNESWSFVKRFGCVTIPATYKDVSMDLNAPIAFSLPSEKNEGICPLSLSQFLGQKHNHFVERVDELLLLRGNELQRSSARNHTISSKFFSSAHALSYNLHDEFLPFVEKQCVQLSPNGDLIYDFKAAEQYLLDVYFMGKPLIELTVRMFQYANADQGSSMGLREKVKQEFLTQDTEHKILAELGSQSVARTCLELLDTCISFLMAAGDQSLRLDVGDMSLGQYVRTVLCMEEVEFGSSLIATKVKLKHIDCLRKLLRDFTVVDPFASVRPKYRAPLDEKDQALLTERAAKMDLNVLCSVLKEYIISILSEDNQSATHTIKSVMDFLLDDVSDQYLSEMPWAAEFPDKLVMGQILETYRCLERVRSV